MRFRRWMGIVFRTAPLLLLPGLALLAPADRTAAAERNRGGGRGWGNRGDGFEALFNGTNLHGWKGDPALWSVQKSNIVGRTTAKQSLKENTFLIWTNGTVQDFELHLEYRITANNPAGFANSGVQYRSRELTNNPVPFVVAGYQADIEAGDRHTGELHEERGRGILAERGQTTRIGSTGMVHPVGSIGSAAEIQSAIRKNDWNEYVMIARGNQLTHLINGRVTAQVTDTQEGERAFSGILALELHAGEPMTVQFRNIRLKAL
jgi:hypothetical protein